MAKQLILIRHAEIDPCYAGKFVGRTDVALSELGECQAVALADAITPVLTEQTPILVSPQLRARQTALTLKRKFDTDNNLREIDFGRWENLTFEEIQKDCPAEKMEQWCKGDPQFSFPDGEAFGDFQRRVKAVVERLLDDDAQQILVITHGGVISTMICQLLGIPAMKFLAFQVARGSVSKINIVDRTGSLVLLGDVCHLNGIEDIQS